MGAVSLGGKGEDPRQLAALSAYDTPAVKEVSRTSTDGRIARVTHLTADWLRALFEGEICAIRVPGYTPLATCAKLGDWFLETELRENYRHETYVDGKVETLHYGVDRIGHPYNLTYYAERSSPVVRHYYDNALPSIRLVRQICGPELSPIDRLRLELDETWPTGANIGTFDGPKMFCGIGRVTLPKKRILELQPHCDSLPLGYSLDGQFSANVYLAVPRVGGELELWDVPPLSQREIIELEQSCNVREMLPPPLRIHPNVGELIVFNTRKPHAVRSFEDGNRVSIQSFIGFSSKGPLQLWC